LKKCDDEDEDDDDDDDDENVDDYVNNKKCPTCNKMLKKSHEPPTYRKINEINNTEVRCKNCAEIFLYKNYMKHLKECVDRIQTCENEGCGKKFKLTEEKHFEICEFKDKICGICNRAVKALKIKDHKNDCPNVMIKCENVGCDMEIFRKDYKIHDESCPHKIYTCKGCDFKNKSDIMLEHEKNCVYVPKKCICEQLILPIDRLLHEQKCPKVLIKCPNNCDEFITRDSVQKHCRYECKNEMIPCINDESQPEEKCGLMLRYMLTEHLEHVCQNAYIPCENGCKVGTGEPCIIMRRDAQKHNESVCPNYEIKCKECKKSYLRKDVTKHILTCENSYCLCPIDKNCFYQTTKILMEKHIHDHKIGHFEKENKEPIPLEIGVHVDMSNVVTKWHTAQIIDKKIDQICIKYTTLDTHNVWINIKTDRIAPYRSITKYGLYNGKKIMVKYDTADYYESTVMDIKNYKVIVVRDIDNKQKEFNVYDNCYESMENNKLLMVGNIYDVVGKSMIGTEGWYPGKLLRMDEKNAYFRAILSSGDLSEKTANIVIDYANAINKILVCDIYNSKGSKDSNRYIPNKN
jgi:hypothetical protein